MIQSDAKVALISLAIQNLTEAFSPEKAQKITKGIAPEDVRRLYRTIDVIPLWLYFAQCALASQISIKELALETGHSTRTISHRRRVWRNVVLPRIKKAQRKGQKIGPDTFPLRSRSWYEVCAQLVTRLDLDDRRAEQELQRMEEWYRRQRNPRVGVRGYVRENYGIKVSKTLRLEPQPYLQGGRG